jgi:low temperature requirement protein LtrA
VHVALQLGRTLFVLGAFFGRHRLHLRHALRTFLWVLAAAPFWIAGALGSDQERLIWWAAALIVEYGATVARYWVPAIGTSQAADWSVEAHHFAERCGLFIIIALGELILITSNTMGDLTLNFYTLTAFLSILVATMSMWWIYFSFSAEKGTEAVEKANDSGREARVVYVYLHIPVICGMLLSAAGGEGLVDHPADAAKLADVVRIVGGAALFLAGTFIVKRVICRRFITSHGTGIAFLAILAPLALGLPLYLVSVGVAAILVAVAVWEELAIRSKRRRRGRDPGGDAEEKISMVEV